MGRELYESEPVFREILDRCAQGLSGELDRPLLELMMNKRIVVKLVPQRIRSWDHRKLGLDPIGTTGTTAATIGAE